LSYYFKIGFRYLLRRKIRTILTILAIVFGVSILIGTLIANDSIKISLEQQIIKKYGYIDIIIVNKTGYYSNSIDYETIKSKFNELSYLDFTWTFQMKEKRTVAFNKNISTSDYKWLYIIGININNPIENLFGSYILEESINDSYKTLEDLLSLNNCCVITSDIAEKYNITINNSIYIYPEKPWSGIIWSNSSTWFSLKVVGIIKNEGKFFEFFKPPVKDIWELQFLEYGIVTNMSIAYKPYEPFCPLFAPFLHTRF